MFKLPMLCCLSAALASMDFDNIGEELEHSCDAQDASVEAHHDTVELAGQIEKT